jgi:hypothetical protein
LSRCRGEDGEVQGLKTRATVTASNRTVQWVMLCCVMAAVAGCSPPAEQPLAKPPVTATSPPAEIEAKAEVEVLVIDGATGQPARSVLVKLMFSPSPGSGEATTNEKGLAMFKDKPTSTAAVIEAKESSGKKRTATQEVPTGFIDGKNQIRIDLQ